MPQESQNLRICTFSVLIGRVSTENGDRILETLEALRNQKGFHGHEVILADRLSDSVSDTIRRVYPDVKLVPCANDTTLPRMRTMALELARGTFVVVTEDHCVPPPGWLASIVTAFEAAPAGTVAVGGPVVNGVCDTALDWATFFCEYSAWLPPLGTGPTNALPGMNVAYRRSAIAALDRAVLDDGFWETTAHPLLARNNGGFFLSDQMAIVHKKKFSFRLFARQRYLYSRYYASLRFGREQVFSRWAMCAATLALPLLILFRITRHVIARKLLAPRLVDAMLYLLIFAVVWAFGEMVGYVAGSGNALSRIE